MNQEEFVKELNIRREICKQKFNPVINKSWDQVTEMIANCQIRE